MGKIDIFLAIGIAMVAAIVVGLGLSWVVKQSADAVINICKLFSSDKSKEVTCKASTTSPLPQWGDNDNIVTFAPKEKIKILSGQFKSYMQLANYQDLDEDSAVYVDKAKDCLREIDEILQVNGNKLGQEGIKNMNEFLIDQAENIKNASK